MVHTALVRSGRRVTAVGRAMRQGIPRRFGTLRSPLAFARRRPHVPSSPPSDCALGPRIMNDLASLVSQYGLAVVFANVFVEQIGAPIPALPTLIVAGAFAIGGKLSIVAVFAVAVLGCL